MWEQANELTEVHLDMDCNMVHAMCDLTDAMDHVSVGGSAGLSTGGWVAGVSMGVGWLGGSDRGISKGKGKEKEQSEAEGDAGCHGMTSLPLLCPPLAASDPICLHSAPSAPTLLQL